MHIKGFSIIKLGILFTLLDFKIQGFDILPDIIGYIFFAIGFSILASSSEHFIVASKFNIPLIILSMFSIYERPVQGGRIQFCILGPFSVIIVIIAVILNLKLMYHLFKGICEIAKRVDEMELYKESNQKWNQYLTLQLTTLLSFILISIPVLGSILVIFLIIAYIILAIAIMGFIKRCGESL